MTSFDQYGMIVDQPDLIGKTQRPETFRVFLDLFAFLARFEVFLMLAKSRKSSFNENIAEFCSVIIIIIIIIILWRCRLHISNSGICD